MSHYSVFKTRWLNQFFLTLLSFMVWRSHILFLTSHTEHHKYTLHPPHDLEVVLPVKVTLKSFLKNAVINPWMLCNTIKTTIRLSSGRLEGEWEMTLFPTSDREKRFYLFNWARLLLFGHLLIIIFSIMVDSVVNHPGAILWGLAALSMQQYTTYRTGG